MSRSSSPSPSSRPMKRKTFARKCERACCAVATYFPLAFVYGLTTWAIWVESGLSLHGRENKFTNPFATLFGVLFYVLLNWSYTTAVFTPAGSPTDRDGSAGYSSLPTHEPRHNDAQSFTVKSTGELRYCKKCQARKPDRAHHCSTCKTCVLKMDHHCPWLATCVGLKNYKAFLLFLIYTCIFCWVCFAVTGVWVWNEALNDSRYGQDLMPVNYILLCVISGIIGLVLTGFTGWHVSLACRGMTTIECLEQTRYLSPLRKTMRSQKFGHENGVGQQNYGQQLAEIHANALPGVTREEEGEVMLPNGHAEDSHDSNAYDSLRKNYAQMEQSRERDRYEDYLDEKESEKLPSAFDLGWRRNLEHLFGEKPAFWFLPVCNTSGDGWNWEPSQKWLDARDAQRREREAQRREDAALDADQEELASRGRWHDRVTSQRHYFSPDGSPSSRMSMQTLRRKSSFEEQRHYSEDELLTDDEEPESVRSGGPSPANGARKQD